MWFGIAKERKTIHMEMEKQMFETVGERVVDSDLGLAELPPCTKPVFFADASGGSSVSGTDSLSKFFR